MGITYDAANMVFHLQANDASYVFQVVKGDYLAHLYWGKKIRGSHIHRTLRTWGRAFSPNPLPGDGSVSLDTLPQEYPAYGRSDFRLPAYQVQLADGSTVADLVYSGYEIHRGKPKLKGLPATYAEDESEAETLEIELKDQLSGLKAVLSYTVFEKYNAMTRSVRFVNEGNADIKILRALSLGIDFPDAKYDMLQLSGAWARERHIVKRSLAQGLQAVESRRGASSHQQNPFVALMADNADEDKGEVFGFNLVYSGNFAAEIEVDQFSTARVVMGINPFDFTWLLQPGESFQTPEAVMVYSDTGLGGMSRTYHKLYRSRLCRGEYRDKARPVLINNWEATYFNFNADKIVDIARAGKELGIELFVLDDGWFGKRDDDTTSLGDWFVDRNKLPDGLEDLVKRVNDLGMKFGLWFEPEMVSPDSELYRKHPDWCIHVPHRSRTTARQQLILDLSRQDVCDYIVEAVSGILASAPISYVKWDMNRHMTEVGSALLPPERQRETAHRYMLGLYQVMDRITGAFPHVLFESCSGGGGRFDPGILHYMPQTWTSDDTDAVERLKIQFGTSVVYPVSSMGSHVSAVPNHQVHRTTPLKTRGNIAMSGNFGYELDLTKFSDADKETVKEQVRFYKEVRNLVQFGEFYRLLSPFDGNETAWMFVSEDKEQAMLTYARVLTEPNAPMARVRLKGLNSNADYRCEQTGEVVGGDELMYLGLNVPGLHGDYASFIYTFKAVETQ